MDVRDSFATELRAIDKVNISKVADGYSIIEKNVPHSFIGKSMIDLRFRNTYGLEILMVKNKASILSDSEEDKIIIPDPNYKFTPDDVLVLFGSDENIKKFNELY
jgi:trk system potassium uptake protein TrkA